MWHNPIERAKAYQRLMDANGWTTRHLAEELDISQTAIAQAMGLLKLPEEVQKQVAQGTLAPSTAYQVSQLQVPEEQVEVAAQIVAGQLRRDDVRDAVKTSKGKPPRNRLKLVCTEHVFTVEGPSDRDTVLDSLHEAVRQLSEWPLTQVPGR